MSQLALFQSARQCVPDDEWYTPDHVLTPVREALGGTIAWDLASCSLANKRVKAEKFFSLENPFQDNHQSEPWQDSFWANPPFTQMAEFAAIVASYSKKRGVLLANANTSVEWFHTLANDCDSMGLTKGRISFLSPNRGTGSNRTGQVLFFWNVDEKLFKNLCTLIKVC